MQSGCSSSTAKGRFLSAEKHWNEGEYSAAVSEFEKVAQKDPQGLLGIQALFRAASTQADYLQQFEPAIRKFERVAENTLAPELAQESKIRISEILLNRIQDYGRAIQQLDRIMEIDPPKFLYQKAKANFYLQKFDRTILSLTLLQKKYPRSTWSIPGELLMAQTVFTRGNQFEQALQQFRTFLKRHPGDPLQVEAKFWIAASLEELDQLDASLQGYEAIAGEYPAPEVIRIRITRIRDRMTTKGRAR